MFLESDYGHALLRVIRSNLQVGGTVCVKLMGAGGSAGLINEITHHFKNYSLNA